MSRYLRAVIASLLAAGLIATGQPAGASQAVPTRQWPVTHATIGSLYGSPDPGGVASLRTWGTAIWCYVQPTAKANVQANLTRLLAPSLDRVKAAKGTATITIGHPAPWVFDNHPRAVAPTKLWACGDHASGVSIPSPKSLKPSKKGVPSTQARIWADYVGKVVDFIRGRYGSSLKVQIEAWNEPNLSSGLNFRLRIPGAAQTREQAASALHTYESIAYDVIRRKGAQGTITLASSPVYQRSDKFTKLYLKAHNKKRRVDVIHVNVYSYQSRSIDGMAKEWDKRAAAFQSKLRKYKKLRKLPVTLSETNLNLINRDGNPSNVRASVKAPATQRRLATATQMNAYYRGYSAVTWLVPFRPAQAAVHIATRPGNPARDSLAVLQGALKGSTMQSCASRKGVRTCTFKAPNGARIKVLWRLSGISKVTQTSRVEVLAMTGGRSTVQRGQKVRVGTTPIVLR